MGRRRDLGKQEGGLPRDMRKLWGVTDMFIILSVMLVLQMHTYVKSFQIIYFKHELLIAYQVNLNKIVKKKINRTCEWIGGAGERERNIKCDPHPKFPA